MRDWRKETESCFRICYKCGGKIEANEERYVSKSKGSVVARFYHLDCGEEIQKKLELETKQKSSECLSELRQLWAELEPKVKEEDLNVADCQRIAKLKNKISELLKTPNTADFLTYWEVKLEFETLSKALTELDNFIKDYASPQTQDKASGDKNRNRKANKTCSHDQVEPYEDDPANYCCSYCWEGESAEFLQVLARKGIKQGEKKTNNPSDNSKEQEQLEQAINNLANKPNKTKEEEEDLEDKKKRLEELNKPTSNQSGNNSWLTPVLLIGGTVLVVGLICWLTKKSSKEQSF